MPCSTTPLHEVGYVDTRRAKSVNMKSAHRVICLLRLDKFMTASRGMVACMRHGRLRKNENCSRQLTQFAQIFMDAYVRCGVVYLYLWWGQELSILSCIRPLQLRYLQPTLCPRPSEYTGYLTCLGSLFSAFLTLWRPIHREIRGFHEPVERYKLMQNQRSSNDWSVLVDQRRSSFP